MKCASNQNNICYKNYYYYFFSQSDGSTETLSVMDVDEAAEHQQLPASSSTLEGSSGKDSDPDVSLPCDSQQSAHRDTSSLSSEQSPEGGPDSEELEPQFRSLSMDSAYGTLSPESLQRELQLQPIQREEEETEEEGVQELELGETETEEVEEDEENASQGSQLSVVQLTKPRRWPHVQSRLQCLQRLSSFALSRSEDNLLQRLRGDNPISRAHSLGSEPQECQVEDRDSSSLGPSRSLSELRRTRLNCSEDCLSSSTLSDRIPAEAPHPNRAPAGLCETTQLGSGPTCQSKTSCDSTGTSHKKRKTPPQQHKKLTLAQLYRIRTTLVLNSTLTAS